MTDRAAAAVLRLVATSSTTGPRDLADLARTLQANGMPAAAWQVEHAAQEIEDWETNYRGAESVVRDIGNALEEYRDEVPTPGSQGDFLNKVIKIIDEWEAD